MPSNKAIKLSDIETPTPRSREDGGKARSQLCNVSEECKGEQGSTAVSSSPCTASAMRLLAFSDRSEKQLRQKLTQKGFEREDIEQTFAYLRSKRYLSDERCMESLARSLATGKLYGRGRIRQEIILRFGKASFDAHYPNVEDSLLEQIDFCSLALALARRHSGRDKKYIFAKLKNNGFAHDEIKYAFENLEGEES